VSVGVSKGQDLRPTPNLALSQDFPLLSEVHDEFLNG
jgi:hypothetical protein